MLRRVRVAHVWLPLQVGSTVCTSDDSFKSVKMLFTYVNGQNERFGVAWVLSPSGYCPAGD